MVNVLDPMAFRQQFGYPELPTEQMLLADKKARQDALIQQAMQKRLQEQQAKAQKLREAPSEGDTWVHGLASMFNRAAGQRDLDRVEGRQKVNDQRLAQATAAAQEAEVAKGQREEQRVLAQARRAYQQHRESLSSQERQAAASLAATKAPTFGEPKSLYLTDGTKTRGVWSEKAATYVDYNTGQPIPIDKVEQHGERKLTSTENKAIGTMPALIERHRAYQDYSAADWDRLAQPGGIPTKTLQDLWTKAERSGLADYVPEGIPGSPDEKARREKHESMTWFNDLTANVELVVREMAIVGVLSNQDADKFEGALAALPGMTGAQLRREVLKITDELDRKNKAYYESIVGSVDPDSYGYLTGTLGKYYAPDKFGAPTPSEFSAYRLRQPMTEEEVLAEELPEVSGEETVVEGTPTPQTTPQAELDAAREILANPELYPDLVDGARRLLGK